MKLSCGTYPNASNTVTLPDLYKKKEVVEKCIAADKWFRKWEPRLWSKIQGYYNLGYVTRDEYFYRILTYVDMYGINIIRIKKHLFDFIGIDREPMDYDEPERKRKGSKKGNDQKCKIVTRKNPYSKQ